MTSKQHAIKQTATTKLYVSCVIVGWKNYGHWSVLYSCSALSSGSPSGAFSCCWMHFWTVVLTNQGHTI